MILVCLNNLLVFILKYYFLFMFLNRSRNFDGIRERESCGIHTIQIDGGKENYLLR